jgi:hypothetical protein
MDEKTLSPDEVFKPALEEFSALPFNDTTEADNFFIKYGVGNARYQLDNPFERFLIYEILLKKLIAEDFEKYQRMHKGVPFYFLAWLSFDIRNYEKALFYIDAAISEDFKNAKGNPLLLPASKFLLLDSEDQVAKRTIDLIYYTLRDELVRFKNIPEEVPLSESIFINQFVRPLLKESQYRTIVSAFYVFLLEFYERRIELRMRNTAVSNACLAGCWGTL